MKANRCLDRCKTSSIPANDSTVFFVVNIEKTQQRAEEQKKREEENPTFAALMRNNRNYGFGMWQSKPKPKPKPTFKCDPPTFKFKTGDEASDMEDESADPVESEAGKKKPEEEEEDEWIQSPFCGDRYRKKDVDLLVAFANKYIKSANESMAKRRKLEESEKEKDNNTEEETKKPASLP